MIVRIVKMYKKEALSLLYQKKKHEDDEWSSHILSFSKSEQYMFHPKKKKKYI